MTADDPIDPVLVGKAARAILASGAVTTCPGNGPDGEYCEGCESEAYIAARAVLEAVADDLWDEAIDEAAAQGTIQIPDNPYRKEPQ